jgi:diguanylate cyclase (GGDEF)-like protein
VSAGPGSDANDQVPAGGLAGFARAWTSTLHGAGYVPVLPAARERIVTALARRLVAALTGEHADAAAGYRIGTDLVGNGFASPESLGRTITLINTRLAADLGLPADTRITARLNAVVESLAAGFAAAVHDRSLDAQEAIRLAALTAQARAEQALRTSQARLRRLATHDPLTGLPNRIQLAERIDSVLATADPTARLALCCIDLDRFTTINTSLGHRVGDRVLIAAADRLGALAAARGLLLARLDRDEFALLVEGTGGAEDVVKVADRALSILAEPFHIDRLELPVTACAGMVERPVGGGDSGELLRAAQTALHWAKADGTGQWRVYAAGRAREDVQRYRLSAAMPAALRAGEFTLAYQPLVRLADRTLVGVEALARWHHPEHGLLNAGRFIGLAVDTGLIAAMDRQLLELACHHAAGWQNMPGPPYVSVNLTAGRLHDPRLVGDVAQTLDDSGLAPHRLQLEITEHTTIGTDRDTVAILRSLAGLGVRIAIDDFGTGHANLACLHALPLHELKLAAVFARRPPNAAPAADRFLAGVVSLGHTLGLTVLAEGIESEAQTGRLLAAGCDSGQGWHLGRPVPPDRVGEVLCAEASTGHTGPS